VDLDINFSLGGLNINLTKDTFCLPFYIPVLDTPASTSQYLTNYASNYLNLAIASFLYFTYSLVVVQLSGITDQILGGITGVTGDSAIANSVKAVQTSRFGKAFDKMSGKEFIDKRIARKAPMLSTAYADPINERLQKSGEVLNRLSPIKTATESAKGVSSIFSSAGSKLGAKALQGAAKISPESMRKSLLDKAAGYNLNSKISFNQAKLHGGQAIRSALAPSLDPLSAGRMVVGAVGFALSKPFAMIEKGVSPKSAFFQSAGKYSLKLGGFDQIRGGLSFRK
jgi:hypothetical protein